MAAAAQAQVFVVDAAGGIGAHFTDLRPAIASVPEGATLLVRAGTYTAFNIQRKALSIVGEGTVNLGRAGPNPSISIGGNAASQPVVLRALDFATFMGRAWAWARARARMGTRG